MEKLSQVSGARVNIFVDYAFACPGEIAGWQFYAAKGGTFNAAVWRPQPDGKHELIGRSKLTVDTEGKHVTYLPKAQRFR